MKGRFWVAVLLQALLLLGMVGWNRYTLATGQSVLLKAAPIDPWDPFRGEYLTLGYEISRLDVKLWKGERLPGSQQPLWVTLRQGEPYWQVVALTEGRPQTGPGEVALRGWVEWIERLPPPMLEKDEVEGEPNVMVMRYGMEQFYVPEGQGRELQGKVADMAVEVRVDRFGRAAIRTVYLEGEPIEWR